MSKARARIDSRASAAAYIAELTRDLAAIARSHELETLAYLLDMAKLEAENATNPDAPAR